MTAKRIKPADDGAGQLASLVKLRARLPVKPKPAVEAPKQASAPAVEPFDAAAWLMERWPGTFGMTRPLAVGISRDIEARHPELTDDQRRQISRALSWFTSRPAYLRTLAAGQHRVDLDGNDAGPPTQEHRDSAQNWLDANPKPARAPRKPPVASKPKAAPVVAIRKRRLVKP